MFDQDNQVENFFNGGNDYQNLIRSRMFCGSHLFHKHQ